MATSKLTSLVQPGPADPAHMRQLAALVERMQASNNATDGIIAILLNHVVQTEQHGGVVVLVALTESAYAHLIADGRMQAQREVSANG